MFKSGPINLMAHIVGWILFAILIGGFTVSGTGKKDFVELIYMPSFLFFILIYLLVFYINTLYLFPALYLKRKYPAYFLLIVALAVTIYFLRPFDRLLADTHYGNGQPPDTALVDRDDDKKPPPNRNRIDIQNEQAPLEKDMRQPPNYKVGSRGRPPIDIVSIVLFVMAWLCSSVVTIFKQWRATEQRILQAEADKANAELSFLRAQINPHFLFNTLNNIYSLVITKNDDGPQAIMKLSRMLRYVTDEATQDYVSLDGEIECVRNYVDLQQLRLSKNVSINFSVTGSTIGKTVPPIIFMTFVENVFKYGISSHEKTVITIIIKVDESNIHFHSQNKIFHQSIEEERNGIGITNAKKRLQFLYPDRHKLVIDEQNGFFTVTLDIEIGTNQH